MSTPSDSSSSSPSPSSSMVPWLLNACSSFASLRARQVTGTHLLRIQGYSTANRMVPQGESIESRTFSAGGHKWRLCFFPNGYNRYEEAGPAVELRFMKQSYDDDVVAAYGLSILGRDGKPVCGYAVGPQRLNRDSSYKHHLGIVVPPEVLRAVKDGGDTPAVRCDLTVTRFDKESRFKYYIRKLID